MHGERSPGRTRARPRVSRLLAVGALALAAGLSVPALLSSAQPTTPVPAALTPPPAYTPPPPVATPSPSGAPSPSATPSGPLTPPPSPAASATPHPYKFVYTPSPSATIATDAPGILEIDLSDQTIHAPGPIDIRVLTTPPVATVTMRALGHDIALPKTADGLFSVDGQIPSVPFFLRGRTYNVDFVAAVPDGRTSSVTIPVTIAR